MTPAPRNRFDAGQWATRVSGLDEPRELAVGEVDGVGQDRPRAEPAGAVVDVDVVARLGEQPARPRRSRRVLGHVRLPPRARSRAASAADSRSMLGRARDGEPRRDRVAEPAVVGAVPALDEVRRLAQGPLEDRRRARSSGRRCSRSIITLPRIARMPCASAARNAASIAAS